MDQSRLERKEHSSRTVRLPTPHTVHSRTSDLAFDPQQCMFRPEIYVVNPARYSGNNTADGNTQTYPSGDKLNGVYRALLLFELS